MKVKTTGLIFILSAAYLLTSLPAKADNPCETAMCLWGKLQNGSTPENCAGPVKDFFDIKKKKDGAFLPDHTFDARQKFMDKCPDPGKQITDKIMNKFGRLKSG